ncbi:MAG: hypothetical protein LUQ38_09140 [Methanotrichaceae archaeon]|nr:hypothetical protein [Methanotrichaceae archaeon]
MEYRPDYDRYIYLYCHSVAQKKRYEQLAKKQGVSLSRFLINKIEEGLNPKPSVNPKDFAALQKEIKKLRDEIRIQSILAERYRDELRKNRESNFLIPDFQGSRDFDKELLGILRRSKGTISEPELIENLGIDATNRDSIRALAVQLVALERYGMIRKKQKGWCWIG